MVRIILAAIAAFVSISALAQTPADKPVDDKMRTEVVQSLGEAMRDNYVFPEIGAEVAAKLSERRAAGAYDSATTASELAELLRADLREIGNDRHLQLRYQPDFEVHRRDRSELPSPTQVDEARKRTARYAYGIPRIERLPGNIGYIDVIAFWRPEHVAASYEAAMRLLSGSDALIVDLRANGGGDPASVAQLMSHFFAQGDERHINSIYSREGDTTREFWTNRAVETRYTGPVYVLTSGYTFSGGEEFAYDMQTQERATLYGETTGGGANPGGPVGLAHGFVAFIPNGRAINPITGTNWEHVGVKPDHAMTADAAMSSAYVAALRSIRDEEADEDRKARLDTLLEEARNGTVDLPAWDDPRG